MKEEYKLTWKEFVPVGNYWTYNSRQKPEEERSVREEKAIIDRLLGLTLYNSTIIISTIVGLEKLVY